MFMHCICKSVFLAQCFGLYVYANSQFLINRIYSLYINLYITLNILIFLHENLPNLFSGIMLIHIHQIKWCLYYGHRDQLKLPRKQCEEYYPSTLWLLIHLAVLLQSPPTSFLQSKNIVLTCFLGSVVVLCIQNC